MFVDHQGFAPVQTPPGLDHGFGQEVDLFTVHLAPVGGHHKGGEFDLGVMVPRDVLHDGVEVVLAQPLAIDFAKQRLHRRRRLGLRDRGGVAPWNAQVPKGVFGQAHFAASHDAVVVHHIQGGQHMPTIGAHFNFGERLKSFGPVHRAIAVEIGHVFAVSVDAHAAQRQGR